jgi:hypothetical protein
MQIIDEMPDTWIRQVADAIEAFGHEVTDCHESAVVIDLTPASMRALDADPGEQLVIGWSERTGVDWGLGRADLVGDPQPLDAATPAEIATRVHLLLTTGKPGYQCDRGHLLPTDFRPPAIDPDYWDDECRCTTTGQSGDSVTAPREKEDQEP